ncbi:LysM peptidoglycan-binding domain-containing protein [Enorma phocaeensis]|uniref:LysM peptidoglycan-binding domain-containing protein n=1 Tax=Enorma phocaeensis TaxID=1871019 RepID=A0A921LTJ5_9ACTN|nr:LysM peptidoglycan-binding domain-containing protein [Enorma phocaeensis]HJG37489.1 LysM peptidoglycan-binding domain-containing protein [Enorma phocaeensis]
MNRGDYIDGNLALSVPKRSLSIANPRFETQIYQLPSPRHRKSCNDLPYAQPKHSSLLSSVLAVFAILVLVSSMLAAMFSVASGSRSAFENALDSTPTQYVEVFEGDSLWTLAKEHPVSGMTTQETTELIRAWNDLDHATLQPGMELLVASDV